MKYSLIYLMVIICLFTACNRGQIAGTYAFGNPEDRGAFGSLLIHPISSDLALFFVEVNKGAPSYNMVQVHGTMKITGATGIYDGKIDKGGEKCELHFKFDDGRVEINVDPHRNRCGYGQEILTDHIFLIKDSVNPIHYINFEGDTVLFQKVSITP